MILIVSSEFDTSTNEVIKYLISNGVNFVRLGIENPVLGLTLVLGAEISTRLYTASCSFDLEQVTAVWHRKHFIEIMSNVKCELSDDEHGINVAHVNDFIRNQEIKSLREYILHRLSDKKSLGNFAGEEGNKLISFQVAKSCGFEIPESIVSSETNILRSFTQRHDRVLAKAIEDGYVLRADDSLMICPYDFVSEKSFLKQDERLFPSCIQRYIDKKIEIRVFVLNDKIWSAAIFSQNNEKTKLDYRDYDRALPNRMAPYNLPGEIKEKILVFMRRMRYDTGSIDLILTESDQYVFLEVNPSGQYGMVGYACNVDLDYEIANFLMS